MAANNSELQQLLLRYIDSGEGKVSMREVLQTTSVEVRYNTLMSVRGVLQYTAVHEGADIDDLDSLKRMMSGFTTDQLYNIVKVGDTDNDTAVYRAAVNGHTNIIKVLLSKLSLEQRFNILKVQSTYESTRGYTALHAAARYNHTSALQAMLTSVSPGQQERLLNIKDGKRETIADIIPLPDLPYDVAAWTNMELKDANQKIGVLTVEIDKQSEANEKLNEKCEQQGRELRDANETMNKQKEAIEKLNEKCEQQGQKLGNTSQKIEVLEADKAQLSEELRDIKQKMDGIEDKQREDNAKLRERCEQQGQELRDTKQTMDGMEAEMYKQREDNAKLSERCEQQGQEMSNAKEQIAVLMTNNIQQRNEMIKQAQDQGIIVDHKLEASNKEQKATIDQLRVELDRQREGNAELAERAERYEMETIQQAQELRGLIDRQERMENVMEEMDRLLGQPVVIGPEMDQEYEDH